MPGAKTYTVSWKDPYIYQCMLLVVMLASSHRVSQRTINVYESSSHHSEGILHHCHAAKMVDADISAPLGFK